MTKEEKEIQELLEESFAERSEENDLAPVDEMWQSIEQELDREQAPESWYWNRALDEFVHRLRLRPRFAFGLAISALGIVAVLWATLDLKGPAPPSSPESAASGAFGPEIAQLERAIAELEATLLEDLEERDPVDACRLHGDGLDAAHVEPVSERVKVRREAPELAHRLIVAIFRHRDPVAGRADVDACRVQMDRLKELRLLLPAAPTTCLLLRVIRPALHESLLELCENGRRSIEGQGCVSRTLS